MPSYSWIQTNSYLIYNVNVYVCIAIVNGWLMEPLQSQNHYYLLSLSSIYIDKLQQTMIRNIRRFYMLSIVFKHCYDKKHTFKR